jgi:hypothetical protein
MHKPLIISLMTTLTLVALSQPAAAKSCAELRQLCHTMRDDKNDCTKPYQRCLTTGTFITPLGRVFKATK